MSLKYKSRLEQDVHEVLGSEFTYEPCRFSYTSSHNYTPDFGSTTNPNVFFEVKGRFRTSSEASKYVDIARDNPNIELIFIFGNPDNKMPGARPRKNGTINTMRSWAEKHGFEWTTLNELKERNG